MKLSEIAEYIIKEYPDCCMSYNNIVTEGCREEWYEEMLIDDLMDFFSSELLHLCGCGTPGDTNKVIRTILHIRDSSASYDEKKAMFNKQLNIDYDNDIHWGLVQFILYVLDEYGIVEHGSSVGGCWLTELGKMYLTVLDAWYKHETSDFYEGEK